MQGAFATGTDPGRKAPRFTPPTIEELAPRFPQLDLLGFVGQGGMGAVYKARQKELDRIVALKILPPDVGKEAAFAERFTREARALARLNHPGIVTIYDFGRADGLYFFLMEYVDGVSLRQLLAKSRVSPREALAIVPQICDALQFAHDQGIVHRDIKPENILLDRRGRVKVADFGLAKLMGGQGEPPPGPSLHTAASALTDAGKLVGTPQYMSPEQTTDPSAVDHRADIYALGMVFYQMLTGVLPGQQIEPPSRKVALDVRLDEVVLRALEKEPSRRYQQVSEVRTAVETIVHTGADDPASEVSSGIGPSAPPSWAGWLRKRKVFAALAFLILLALPVGLIREMAIMSKGRGSKERKAADHQVMAGAEVPKIPESNRPSAIQETSAQADWLSIRPLEVWIKDARSSDPQIKKMAELALTQLGTNALPGIIKILNESTEQSSEADDRRVAFAEAVQYLGPAVKSALPAFERLLRSGQQERAYSGARTLAFAAPIAPEAFSILTNALSDPAAGVRDAANHGIGWCLSFFPNDFALPALPLLARNLKDPVDYVRADAAAALMIFTQHQCQLNRPEPDFLAPALLELLHDKYSYARAHAAYALACSCFRDQLNAALPKIQRLLDDPDENVRRAAASLVQMLSQTNASAEVRLQLKVNYAATEASVQDIVENLAEQAGLKYDREKSRSQTAPLCQNWVRNVAIEDKTCQQALIQILEPVGLRYELEDGTIVLSRLPENQGPSPAPKPLVQAARADPDEPPKLKAAREALRGPQKDYARAKQLLLEIVGQDRANIPPMRLCYAYVYLGYIEDRAGHRQEAINWYRQALATPEGDGIRQCAEAGLKQPLTWIRHLDEGPSSAQPAPSVQARPAGKGYITIGSFPEGLTPATTLSAQQQREDFDFLCKAIDETYAAFELKAINWPAVCRRYQQRLDPAGDAEAFYRLLFELVNELKDTHSWLQNWHRNFPPCEPELLVALVDGKPFVLGANARLDVEPGSEVVWVDGFPVEDKIEQLRLQLPACSSERAFRREACRYLLAGERDTQARVRLRLPDSHEQTIALRRTRTGGVSTPPRPPCAFDLKPGRFVQFGHSSGLGYIRITSFDSHEEVAPEFDQALEALRRAPGLILDIRDNPGGYGQPQILGRLLQGPALCSISFVKNGPRHGDLARHEEILEPTGRWQYGGPIALLVNEGTGSAADLFACELRSAKRVVTVGSTTHGNLSGVAAYAVLPCGLIVRISNGYICDATGKPIEGIGNEPDVPVSPSLGDILAGRDPALERAAALLKGKLHQMGVTPGKQ